MRKATYALVLALSVLCLLAVFAAHKAIAAPYDYPIKPGSNEWKSLTTHTEMIEACQIPAEVLKDMTTASLVETVLNYPLINDMYAYNNIQLGFMAVSRQFNGISKLCARENAGKELIKKYAAMTNKNFDSAYKLTFIEMLLSQPEVISNLSPAQKENLLKVANQKYTDKQKSTTNPFMLDASRFLIDSQI